MAIEKNQNSGAVLELPAKQFPFGPIFEVNGMDWQCYLAGSSKTAPRMLIFSIVLVAKYSFYVKPIATYAPQKVDIIIHSQTVCIECGDVLFPGKKKRWPIDPLSHLLSNILDKPILVAARLETLKASKRLEQIAKSLSA